MSVSLSIILYYGEWQRENPNVNNDVNLFTFGL